ncbi:MAG: Membrane proteins related to metalloendopeptidases [uncultured Sulfurovum sp.]|uniref:Membrane proteins related to metalloendopeptidases n=1 Tax=uncultured Sulfurovum sp. TaxID=269237 RepID=A0A6S6TV13_9BACT|nr:MAG: Membrane proteins related to metalloendopeptidases [uncultured Sulfurovum sp.]
MRLGILLLVFSMFTFAAKVQYAMWEKGLGFGQYLEKYQISQKILKDLDKDDLKLIDEIGYSYRYFELIASNGVLLQTLLPIGEELQVHLFRTHTGYKIEILPISYQQDTHVALLAVDKSPHSDIVHKVKNKRLAGEFTRVLKHSVDFRGIQKKDKIAIVYDQKMRLGQPLGMPDIKVAMLESHGKKNYVFKHTDGKYYNEKGSVLIQKYMQKPVKHVRITSHFTNRRFHPVLKRWKAHHGTDFGGRRGTPILAAADGKVSFSGWKGGYGKVIKIQHKDGYVTLYAHQSRLKSKKGEAVKAGEIIGYIGSTGRSTGPHLHFGLYKNGRAIDPMRMVKFSKEGLTGTGKKAFLTRKKKYKNIINKIFESNIPSYVWNTVNEVAVLPSMKKYYQNRGW